MGWRSLLVIVLSSLFLLACSPASDSAPDSGGATATEGSPKTTASPSSSPNSSPNSSNESSGSSPENSPARTESGSPKAGGKLIRLFRDPPTLDPHLTTDSDSSNIVVEIFGGLVTIDPELNIVPDLAESWDISPDGRVYTFHLRRDAKFHDGKPVTAEDVRLLTIAQGGVEDANQLATHGSSLIRLRGVRIGQLQHASGMAAP